MKTEPKRVIVIGAGASGIAAATKLMEHNFKHVTILEAEPRIGGRVKSIPYGGAFLDMGGQWLEGQVGNVIYDMVKDLNLLEPSEAISYDILNFYQTNGTEMSKETNDKLLAMMSVFDFESKEECGDGSLGSIVIARYADVLKKDENKDIDPELKKQFLHWLHCSYRGMYASDSWFDASCRGFAEGKDCEGDLLQNWKDGKGYKTVLDVMMKKIPNPSEALPIESNLHLNKIVRAVKWSTEGPSTIECDDGTEFEADHVICTIPLGVLRERYQKIFSPELPLKKRNAIEGLKMGTLDKIYLEFEKPFWPTLWPGFGLLWCDADLEEIRSDPEEKWMEDFCSVSTVQYHPNLLCAWVNASGARQMESFSEDVVKRVVTKWLRRCLKNWIISEPVAMLRSHWSSEPNFNGSYSYMSILGDDLSSSRADLADPILNASGVPVLQFAGEASELVHFATVHGAVQTGYREAQRLIDLYEM